MTARDDKLTKLLREWSAGDEAAAGELFRQTFGQLRQLAARQLGRERAGHTLQPTALVNEVYLKLTGGTPVAWQSRVHFFAVAARAVRQVLVDHGRRRQAQRRGAGLEVTLEPELHGEAQELVDLLALDHALDRLAELNERHAEVVELRYFGGLTAAEVAAATGRSEATVSRDWRAARAWLYHHLGQP